MSFATLGFAGGPKAAFRIDPSQIAWDFQVHTSVTETVGGRVVQVTGATLSDITVSGLYGEDRGRGRAAPGADHPGAPWRLAEEFVAQIRAMMAWQSGGATVQGQATRPPAVFAYAPMGWRFRVYIKSLADSDGGAVTHQVGKIGYGYTLALFIVQGDSDTLAVAGGAGGVVGAARSAAIDAYISRVADGVGWHYSPYNGGTPAATAADPAAQTGSPQ
jgi:hypothetical protein